MGKLKELTGLRFSRLTVIKRVGNDNRGLPRWECKCDCGNTTFVSGEKLRKKRIKSCGCLLKEITMQHKLSKTRLYRIWVSMKSRCENPQMQGYKYYGGRGVTVCDEWREVIAFYEWAINNGYKDGLTIDRIDVNGNYEPSNCRWATAKEQSNNRTNNRLITYNEKTLTISQWADETGIKQNTLNKRINRGHWDIGRALGYE